MNRTITLTAADGHKLSAYEAKPAGTARGGLVVVQEIFGVNPHIRWVADGFAADGYDVIAPAIFDRAEPGVELGYEGADRDKGLGLRQKIPLDEMLLDIAAAVEALKGRGKVGIVGYCLGGTLAWLAAARIQGLAAAIGYYGGAIAAHLAAVPRAPVLLHFGEEDGAIPPADVARIRAAADPKTVEIFTYAGAGHAFNRHGTGTWREAQAKLACERTVAFLRMHVG